MKITIYIISLILFFSLVAGGIYYFYFSSPINAPVGQNNNAGLPGGEGGPAIQVQPGFKSISDATIISPVLSADGKKILYFDKKTGQLFQVNLDGSDKEKISQLEMPNLIKAVWSPDRKKFIAAFSTGDGPAKILYDLTFQKTTPLNKNIADFAFGPDNQFVYYLDGQLYLSNNDYTKVNTLYSIKISDPILNWLGNKIYITAPASDFAVGALFSFDPIEKLLIKIVSGPALLASYSADGNKIISSSKNILSVTSAVKTLANKCVFSNSVKEIYCAVPKSTPEKFVLDDYYQGLVEFNDEFWKINLDSGAKVLIKSSEATQGGVDAQSLLLSPAEDYLIFINQKDGKLYSLRL